MAAGLSEHEIKIGISACLLGQKVRYDGGHKLDHFLADTLGRYVTYVPVCPEVECGLSVPREAMRLVGEPASPRLVTVRSGQDLTSQMLDWAARRVRDLERDGLCGFIFKSDSPSSGMERVKVYNAKGVATRAGSGLFARAFMDHFPLLPVEEEGRLHDPDLRENFIERVFVFRRWRAVVEAGLTVKRLIDFHTDHKLLLMAHSPEGERRMGRLVADARATDRDRLIQEYQCELMAVLRLKATPGKHANVLQHMMGYFKERLAADEKQELLETITAYRTGLVPLIVPITLVSHHVRKYADAYLSRQVYLHPHPLELQLRNHV